MSSRFIDALLASPLPVIMEVKRSDADGVQLMGERTVAEIVAEYSAVGAPCISVVTGRWFGGTGEMLREAAAVTDLPILRKDFITREKQVIEAKEMGASAVLLTAKIMPRAPFQKMIETILAHGLTPFVEVADHDEIASVVHAEQCIVAVNNKDILTQEREPGDIDQSRSLLEATIATGTPCPVSASAITDPKVAAELVAQGYKGLLIGTGLLLAPSVRDWVTEFEQHRHAIEAAGAR
jgi:indole-3-glycerol phosphate synthase